MKNEENSELNIKKEGGSKRKKITVVHNEFIEMFNVSNSDIKVQERNTTIIEATKKIDKNGIKNVCFKVEREKEVNGNQKIMANVDCTDILFLRQSFLLYTFLFDYYVTNQEDLDDDGYLVITFNEIHREYRNKPYNAFGQIDKDTFNSYIKGFQDLHKKKIEINLRKCKGKRYKKFSPNVIRQNLIEYEIIKNKAIRYSLGDLGRFLFETKRMSSKLPIELVQVFYDQIDEFFIGMYLTRIIYIERKKKENEKGISIKSILKQIMCFNRRKLPKGINKYQEIKQAPQKTKLLKNFQKYLEYVLILLKDNKVIKGYDFTVDKLTAKNYALISTQVIIQLR